MIFHGEVLISSPEFTGIVAVRKDKGLRLGSQSEAKKGTANSNEVAYPLSDWPRNGLEARSTDQVAKWRTRFFLEAQVSVPQVFSSKKRVRHFH
jgi:hypothetical protein